MIIIYSASNCRACEQAKAWFARQGLKYEERRVDQDDEAAADLEALGIRSVPVVWVGGQYIVGYAPRKFEKALEVK